MSDFDSLVNALMALTQGEEPEAHTLPVARDEWDTRPDTVSYGVVSMDFEANAMRADNVKQTRALEGSMDLFSMTRDGAGWVSLIENTLTAHCGACWSLNSRTWERETGLFHWEWVFQAEG